MIDEVQTESLASSGPALVNCLEFRRQKLSDPNTSDQVLINHSRQCRGCREFAAELIQFDDSILTAAEVDVPAGLSSRILLAKELAMTQQHRRWIQFSTAAILLIVATIGSYELLERPVIDHALIHHERNELAFVQSRLQPIGDAQIRQVLNSIHLDTSQTITDVTFAANCIVEGHLVGHFVVQRGTNLYTIFVLPKKFDSITGDFSDNGRFGLVLPQSDGSYVAIIGTDGQPNHDRQTLLSLAIQFGSAMSPLAG